MTLSTKLAGNLVVWSLPVFFWLLLLVRWVVWLVWLVVVFVLLVLPASHSNPFHT